MKTGRQVLSSEAAFQMVNQVGGGSDARLAALALAPPPESPWRKKHLRHSLHLAATPKTTKAQRAAMVARSRAL